MKKLILLISILLAISLLSACAINSYAGDKNPDQASDNSESQTEKTSFFGYTTNSPVYWNDIKVNKTEKDEEYTDENAPKTYDFLVGDKTVVLKYDHSKKPHNSEIVFLYYVSEDGNIELSITDHDKLLSIKFKDGTLPIPDNMTTEEAYKNWLRDIYESYGVNDFDERKCYSKTKFMRGEDLDYFYYPGEGEDDLEYYEFTFCRTIGGVDTADSLDVRINMRNKSVSMYFQGQDFKNVSAEDVAFDEEWAMERLEDHIDKALKKDKFEYVSYEIVDKIYRRSDDKFFCDYTIRVYLKAKVEMFGQIDHSDLRCMRVYIN